MTKLVSGTKGENVFVAGKLTISTILKHNEAIKIANVAKGVRVLRKKKSLLKRLKKIVDLDKRKAASDSISEAKMHEKTKMLHITSLKISLEQVL